MEGTLERPRVLEKPIIRYGENEAPVGLPPRKSPENRMYFLLIQYKDGDDNTWLPCLGRTEAYDEAIDTNKIDTYLKA